MCVNTRSVLYTRRVTFYCNNSSDPCKIIRPLLDLARLKKKKKLYIIINNNNKISDFHLLHITLHYHLCTLSRFNASLKPLCFPRLKTIFKY